MHMYVVFNYWLHIAQRGRPEWARRRRRRALILSTCSHASTSSPHSRSSASELLPFSHSFRDSNWNSTWNIHSDIRVHVHTYICPRPVAIMGQRGGQLSPKLFLCPPPPNKVGLLICNSLKTDELHIDIYE